MTKTPNEKLHELAARIVSTVRSLDSDGNAPLATEAVVSLLSSPNAEIIVEALAASLRERRKLVEKTVTDATVTLELLHRKISATNVLLEGEK